MARIKNILGRRSLSIRGNCPIVKQIQQALDNSNALPFEVRFKVRSGLDQNNPFRTVKIDTIERNQNPNHPNSVWMRGQMRAMCNKEEWVSVDINFDLLNQTGTIYFNLTSS